MVIEFVAPAIKRTLKKWLGWFRKEEHARDIERVITVVSTKKPSAKDPRPRVQRKRTIRMRPARRTKKKDDNGISQ